MDSLTATDLLVVLVRLLHRAVLPLLLVLVAYLSPLVVGVLFLSLPVIWPPAPPLILLLNLLLLVILLSFLLVLCLAIDRHSDFSVALH